MQDTPDSTEFSEDDNWSRHVQADGSDRGLRSTSNSFYVADNDDDNWSRQVETDSIVEDGFVPRREEPTLKEKLVERERQRRVETERARLKRQFALREEIVEDEGETGSVAGTVGEGSIVAPVESLLEDEKMNYPMERFLQEQGTILEEDVETNMKRDTQGVVMERFLQEPVLVEPASDIGDDHPQSMGEEGVSFEMNLPTIPDSPKGIRSTSSVAGESIPEVSTPPRSRDFDNTPPGLDTPGQGTPYLANVSMDCVNSEETGLSHLAIPETPTPDAGEDILHTSPHSLVPPESPMLDQPRVLGLTQAEIEELAAIEEVSQQNAPPSERDDLSASSFVGELVSDFGGPINDQTGATTLSQGTTTTAMESASIFSGMHSVQRTVSETPDEHQSIDDALGNASVNSNLMSAGESVSVTANPPSELGHEDTLFSPLPDLPDTPAPEYHMSERRDEPDDLSDMATLNAGVVNRRIRPGMVATPVMHRSSSGPEKVDFDLDGFDYDKDAPPSPSIGMHNLSATDLWSPGSKMSLERSPFRPQFLPRTQTPPDFEERNGRNTCSETTPLIPDIPSEIVTKGDQNHTLRRLQYAFHLMRNESPEVRAQSSKKYLQSTSWQRAVSERSLPLALTVLLELPVVLMIAGRSDSLFIHLGRSTFVSWICLLFLGNALSGSVGLQTSSLTAHAIACGQVTLQNYGRWLRQEIGATSIIGLGIGTFLGLVALALSRGNLWFGVTMMLSQTCGILTAGVTGALIPPLVALGSNSRASRWTGLLETALQDLISTYVMVVLSYKLLGQWGQVSVDSSDACFVPEH